jgi:curved DNA-binding protein CbpA
MPQNTFDPWSVLGVPHTATGPEIRKRFYDLSRKFHSDKKGDHEVVISGLTAIIIR